MFETFNKKFWTSMKAGLDILYWTSHKFRLSFIRTSIQTFQNYQFILEELWNKKIKSEPSQTNLFVSLLANARNLN